MVGKFYSVVAGKIPGIYTDWKTAEKMIKGFSGAIYKSFTNIDDAQAFMNLNKNVQKEEPITENKTVIYTDGSFVRTDKTSGFGIIIIYPDGTSSKIYGPVPLEIHKNNPTNNISELYAIYMALSIIPDDVILYTDSQYSISCLTHYIHNWIKNGWEGVANSELIKSIYKKMEGKNISLRYVRAHCGISLNEEVDRLANLGRNTKELITI